MVELENEFPDLGLLPAESVETLLLHAEGFHVLQALVHQDGDAPGRQLLLSQWDAGDLCVLQC